MKPKELLNADYLDIVFDQRNKSYGSYELRKHYDQRLRKAAILALTGVAAMLSFSFISANHHKEEHKSHITPTEFTKIDIQPIEPQPKILPPTPPPAAPKQVATVQHSIPKIEPDKIVTPDELPTENKKIGDAVVGTRNHDGDSTGIVSDITGPKGGPVTSVIPDDKPAPIPNWVEQIPVFNGDINAYLTRNLRYPDMAHSNNIEGRVIIKFVVNEDGSVSDLVVARGIGGGCDEEALRVVRGMPKWKPGKMNGRAVKVYFNLPIVFKLAD